MEVVSPGSTVPMLVDQIAGVLIVGTCVSARTMQPVIGMYRSLFYLKIPLVKISWLI